MDKRTKAEILENVLREIAAHACAKADQAFKGIEAAETLAAE